jgi:hypothetical protein
MCQFVVTTHEYTECKLLETTVEADTEPTPESGPDAEPSKSSTTTRLIRLFHLTPADAPVVTVSGPSSSTEAAGAASSEPEMHQIKTRTYFQCSVARNHADLWDVHVDKRYCPNATETQMAEDAEEDSTSRVRRRPCPVCEAVENTIKDKLCRVIVVSINIIGRALTNPRSIETSTRYSYARSCQPGSS